MMLRQSLQLQPAPLIGYMEAQTLFITGVEETLRGIEADREQVCFVSSFRDIALHVVGSCEVW